MTSGLGPLQGLSYSLFMNMPQGTGGRKFYIPVPQSQVIYSQFEHVSGFAAPGAGSSQDDQSGITVDKVQILNSLIDQLVSMKTKETAAASVPKLTENQIDSLIKEYQGKIHTTLTAEKENPNPYKKLPVPPTGAVFNLSV